jgi:uncharacterized coiled-coil protein SlyX
MQKKINPEIDVTKFVNIDDEKFVFYINKQPREIEAGETKVMPVYVAQIGAKHLVDKILQKKYNIKDTLRDSELRRSLFAKILPDMAFERNIEPLSDYKFEQAVQKELERQNKLIDELSGKAEADKERIKKLELELNLLKARLKKQKEDDKSDKKEVEKEAKSKESNQEK